MFWLEFLNKTVKNHSKIFYDVSHVHPHDIPPTRYLDTWNKEFAQENGTLEIIAKVPSLLPPSLEKGSPIKSLQNYFPDFYRLIINVSANVPAIYRWSLVSLLDFLMWIVSVLTSLLLINTHTENIISSQSFFNEMLTKKCGILVRSLPSITHEELFSKLCISQSQYVNLSCTTRSHPNVTNMIIFLCKLTFFFTKHIHKQLH